jgi:hypothetical protein
MPLVVLEIVGLTVFTPDLELITNVDESVGCYIRVWNNEGSNLSDILHYCARYYNVSCHVRSNPSRNLLALFNRVGSVAVVKQRSMSQPRAT